MTRNKRWRSPRAVVAAGISVTLLTFGLGLTGAAASGRTSGQAGSQAPKVGQARMVSVHSVVVKDLPSGVSHQTVKVPGPLRKNGTPTWKTTPSSSAPTSAQKVPYRAGPDVNGSVRSGSTGPLVTPPTHIHKNFDGTNLANSSCGCQPPDPNAAAGGSQTVEATNLSLAVYSKTGSPPSLLKRTPLSTFLADSRPLSDPRITYDTIWKRWALVAIPIPTSTTSTPGLDLAVSKTAKATGGWWVYHLTFSGGAFPAGTLLDYPMLGQQQDAYAIGSNNFRLTSSGFSYIGSTVFAVSKARVYNGLGISFPAFGVAFSTHPGVTGNVPMDSDGNEYLLAADPGNNRLILYKMTDPATPNTTAVTLLGTPSCGSCGAPTRGAHQPGGKPDIDALDGRIDAAPVVANGFLWFAHGINISGFPGIQYGAVSLSGASATVANAFHGSTSDDINPSIGAFPLSGGTDFIYLNWAYTDASNGIPVTDVVSGVSPGEGVPNLIGVDTQLVRGGTSNETRFGDFSSVSIAPYADHTGCGIGRTAYVAQEYFNPSSGDWATRIADVGFC